jgi:hypothetical protein
VHLYPALSVGGLLPPETMSPHTFPYGLLYICPALRPRLRCPYSLTVRPFPLPLSQRRKPHAIVYFVAQSRGFCTRCLRFTNLVAKTHARLASSDLLCLPGWNARLPVASTRPSRKVSSYNPPSTSFRVAMRCRFSSSKKPDFSLSMSLVAYIKS